MLAEHLPKKRFPAQTRVSCLEAGQKRRSVLQKEHLLTADKNLSPKMFQDLLPTIVGAKNFVNFSCGRLSEPKNVPIVSSDKRGNRKLLQESLPTKICVQSCANIEAVRTAEGVSLSGGRGPG